MPHPRGEAMPQPTDLSDVEIECLSILVDTAADVLVRTEIPIGATVVRLA